MSNNEDLIAMAISFAWFAAGAWVALGSDIISKVFNIKQNSMKFHFIGTVIMSYLIYKFYQIIQKEADARAQANATP
jgi:hypothetical protein